MGGNPQPNIEIWKNEPTESLHDGQEWFFTVIKDYYGYEVFCKAIGGGIKEGYITSATITLNVTCKMFQ